ncbi:alpha/beta hydrolase [Micromonospora sp. NBC_01813]|uniref:alpha/beta hydrolase n=1 Tax=Micromonospora sp. NBC_01813 TaxID=2975988 RepID=UPI002DDB934B|nr:alpha/beta hydrolase [Micromonospora sp. NBC_01813]WSA11179.1 alpha/beta hydrolase [Micromonospora sp. NBC_01813]
MTVDSVLVVAGPGLDVDPQLLHGLVVGEAAGLGVTGDFVAAADAGQVRQLLHGLGVGSAVVLLPGPDPAVRSLLTAGGDWAARTVHYDPEVTGPQPTDPAAVHLYGRGVWGLAWAIRHAVHRLRRPALRVAYGPDPEQWGELRLPPAAGDRVPVAVLLHGGFWRSIWAADLMDALAIDLADRGFAAWNLEYRRPDRHGWPATTADVATGLAVLANLPELTGDAVPAGSLDLDRVAVFGHSAGGQLALRLAADTAAAAASAASGGAVGGAGVSGAGGGGVGVALAVSLAGVLDLTEGERRQVGTGAVAAALGGGRDQIPQVYAASDPLARLPIGVPQLIVQGAGDDLDLIDFNRRYVAAARAAGEDPGWLEQPGDHFSVIDPAAPIWSATMTEVDRRLGR